MNPFDSLENYLYKKTPLYDYNSKDTPLHISFKKNNTEVAEEILKHSKIGINRLNAYGESALHFAAANQNLFLLKLILKENSTNINIQQESFFDLPLADLFLKIILLFHSRNYGLRIVSDSLFLIASYKEFFNSFRNVSHPTPLHYAVGGMYLHQNTEGATTRDAFETVKFLIDNGADPNFLMRQYHKIEGQIIPYVVTLAVSTMLSLNLKYKLPILISVQAFFGYSKSVKPIDLFKTSEKDSCVNNKVYQLLKQYTVLNQYTSKENFNFLEYALYKLNLISDTDSIKIEKYGSYKGGSGNDHFIISKDFVGKSNGFAVIIHDYSEEDVISCVSCSSNDFTIRDALVIGKSSRILNINDELEITLIGYTSDIIGGVYVI